MLVSLEDVIRAYEEEGLVCHKEADGSFSIVRLHIYKVVDGTEIYVVTHPFPPGEMIDDVVLISPLFDWGEEVLALQIAVRLGLNKP